MEKLFGIRDYVPYGGVHCYIIRAEDVEEAFAEFIEFLKTCDPDTHLITELVTSTDEKIEAKLWRGDDKFEDEIKIDLIDETDLGIYYVGGYEE